MNTDSIYCDNVSSPEALRQAIWLELRAVDAATLARAVLDFGVHRLDVPDAEHLYFQAPGGQVFRVVGVGDDLSRFEH